MSNNELTFKNSSDGKIPIEFSRTSFPTLWPIASVDILTVMNVSGNDVSYECPTDKVGLEQLIDSGQSFLSHVNNANLAIGMVLTDIECSEEIQSNFSDLVWLQVGLVEIAIKVSSSIEKFQHVLKVQNPE